jgi:hypothetical protein
MNQKLVHGHVMFKGCEGYISYKWSEFRLRMIETENFLVLPTHVLRVAT